jgi:type I restriction enzyme M protein
MLSKMKPAEEGGSRLAIVFNGSPLFTGAAGSGPSEIRRFVIENDWLEAVVALHDQLFYDTGILDLLLGRHEPQARRTARQGAARGRARVVGEDAKEPRREAQADLRRADSAS